jgi:YVTN family beta-propeller protein
MGDAGNKVKAYVANFGDATVSVIDENPSVDVSKIKLPDGADPTSVAVTPDGKFVYVLGVSSLYVISTHNHHVVETHDLDTFPSTLSFTPDGQFAYIANQNQTVSELDVSSNQVIATIPISGIPSSLKVTSDGFLAYATYTDGVAVIDTELNTVLATIPLNDGPISLDITPDDQFVYVMNRASNSVSVIETSSNTVVATISIPSSKGSGQAIAISPDGLFAYALVDLDPIGGYIGIIETSSHTIVRDLLLPAYSDPQAIAFTSDGKFALVTDAGLNVTYLLNTVTHLITKTIPVGTTPAGVAIVPMEIGH